MSAWKKNYKQNLNLKNTIIVYGNINDYTLNDYMQYERSSKFLLEELNKKREKIITYDTLNGLNFKNITEEELFKVISNTSKKDNYQFNNGKIENKANSQINGRRNFGDDDSSSSVNKIKLPLDKINDDFKEPNSFFELIYGLSKTNLNISIFIELADSIFGKMREDQVLDDNQRVMVSNLLEATELFNGENINRNIVISIKKETNLPSILHIGNVKIGKVLIPIPDRTEREDFFQKNFNNYRIDLKDVNNFIDALDGVSLVEMEQIANLTKLPENLEKNYKEIISLFRYGNLDNPWNKIRKEKIANTITEIGKRVKGQEDALRKVKEIVMKAYTGISGLQHSSKKMKPKGTLFLVGPTGVGKTELAKALAEFLFGDESACIRFDMSEFNAEHSDQRLIGAPPGYVGHEAGGELTNKVKERPFSVLLFDEIEKAHSKILDKFLQILEDGRLTDGRGETVYFSDCIIIFTSNIGTKEITMEKENSKSLFKAAVELHFKEKLGRPEILNRIGEDNIIPFDFIRDDNFLKEIVVSKLKNIDEFLKNKYSSRIEFENKDATFLNLVKKADRNNGGRGALNDLENYLINPLSEFLFYNDDSIRNKTIVAKYSDAAECFVFSIK